MGRQRGRGLTEFQFLGLLLHWIKTLLLQDRALKILFGINNLISDKLEYSEVVNQLLILMLQIIVAFMLRQWKHWFFMMASLVLLEKNSKLDNVSLQQIFNCMLLLKYRYHGSFPRICSNSSQWDFCHYNYATQQYARWALDNDCELSSIIVFCRLSRSTQFPQALVQADDARTTAISSHCLLFLHDICSFSSLQVPTRRNYWNSQSQYTFYYK